jgi:hypothetical protein
MVILPEGGALPPRPNTLLGKIVGRMMAAPAVLKKWRRLMEFSGDALRDFFCMLAE